MKLLILNSGSSSQKTSLYDFPSAPPSTAPPPLWEGKLDWRDGRATLEAHGKDATRKDEVQATGPSDATPRLLEFLTAGPTAVINRKSEIDAVGHRIVNGGAEYTQPVFITPAVKTAIEKMAEFAPLHNKAGLEGIALVERIFGPQTPQIAVFDTGFHRHLPLSAAVYPGPYEWFAQGIRRYGFHGINHQYVSERAAQLLGKNLMALKLVSCHLGNGCSLAAVRDGRSIDTTMGFTPLEGLMMGTRSGDVDPSLISFLAHEERLEMDEVMTLLEKRSGLLGVSGVSLDTRVLMREYDKNNRVELAMEMFAYRLVKAIGAYLAALGGARALIFGGGIAENTPLVRERVCESLRWCGLEMDYEQNRMLIDIEGRLSTEDSPMQAYVIPVEETLEIAHECVQVMGGGDAHRAREKQAIAL